MTPKLSDKKEHPMIVKYVQDECTGVRSYNITRNAIGYVMRGRKFIYYGDVRHELVRGELFFFEPGNHYIEDMPVDDKPFEQIVFYYEPSVMGRILSNLSLSYGVRVEADGRRGRPSGRVRDHVSHPAWGVVRNFFLTVDQYIREDIFMTDDVAGKIKMTELVYLLLSNPDCRITERILNSADAMKGKFENVVMSHVFSNVSLDELADKCNRSLTSFKKEFRRHFHEPPHKWFIRQRLMHSRMLLLSTDKSVCEISADCSFPNTSHFIKLFKKEFGITPAGYRHSRNGKTAVNEGSPVLSA